MADTLVAITRGGSSSSQGLWGPYWSDENTAICVFVDDIFNLNFARTTDKGASWTVTEVEVGAMRSLCCWYDKETPGNTGTLIHVAWLDSGGALGSEDAFYMTLDVADGSQGAKRTVDGTLTVSTNATRNRLAITRTVSGNIIYVISTQTEIVCYKSSDLFATAGTTIADVFETTTEEDYCLLFPAATGDDNDACAIFWDRSANALSVKMWDDSAGTWTETSISGSMVDDPSDINMDGSVRHSDGHVLLAAHSNDDNAGDDLRTWDLTVDSIGSPAITAKANIFTDQGESAECAVFINQQNDDVYVAYLKGNPTWYVTVDVVFHISTDGMGSWGAEQAYSESAADDFRRVQAGRTVGDDGGRYQPSFFDDDQAHIYINETNDIEIAATEAFVTGQAVISGVGSLAAIVGLTLPASAGISGVGTLVAAGTIGEIRLGAAVLSGAGTMSIAAVATRTGEVHIAGVGTLTVVGKRIVPGQVVLTGVGSLSAIGEKGLQGIVALSGAGSLSAVVVIVRGATVVISGTGTLIALGRRIVPGQVVLTGVGSLSAIGELGGTLEGRADLAGVGSMTVTVVVTYSARAVLTGAGTLSVVAERIVPGAVVMAGVGSLSVIGERGLEGQASLSGVGSLSAVGQRIALAQVALAGAGSLSTVGVITLMGAATLTGVGTVTVIGDTGVMLYTQLGQRVYEVDTADYPTGTLFYLETNISVSGSGSQAGTRLFNLTDAAVVTGSEILISGPVGPTWERSASFSLASGVKKYRIEYGGLSGGVYTPHGAALRVESA